MPHLLVDSCLTCLVRSGRVVSVCRSSPPLSPVGLWYKCRVASLLLLLDTRQKAARDRGLPGRDAAARGARGIISQGRRLSRLMLAKISSYSAANLFRPPHRGLRRRGLKG